MSGNELNHANYGVQGIQSLRCFMEKVSSQRLHYTWSSRGQFLVLGRELSTQFESGREASEGQREGWPKPLECIRVQPVGSTL